MAESQSQSSTAQSRPSMFMFKTPMSAPASSSTDTTKTSNLPKGIVLDKDGKPCRLCTDAASWRTMTKQAKAHPQSQSQQQEKASSSSSSSSSSTTSNIPTQAATAATAAAATAATTSNTPRPDCPPDVETLGRATWTFLHSLTATYPTVASADQQSEMRTFLKIFSRIYPCWVCAEDFQASMAKPGGEPQLKTRKEFGNWMCQAHNEVNRKLGKKEFDCRFWEERWRTGWKDGSCDE